MGVTENIFLAIIVLVIGFVFLVKGADLFVESASSIAKQLNVPAMIIGLTVVALGTSLPELAVSATAALHGSNELAISNVIGSNIFNLTMVIGMCAVIVPIHVKSLTLKKDFPIAVGSILLLIFFGMTDYRISHGEGVVFVVLCVLFIFSMVQTARRHRKENAGVLTPDVLEEESDFLQEAEEIKLLPPWKCGLYFILGTVGIVLGADWVVSGASSIAAAFGLSQNLIGLTIVAVGTGLPEFVTSVTAARKKEPDLALGNALGSNIFNILLVLGCSSAIRPLAFGHENLIDAIILLAISLLIWGFTRTRRSLNRIEGAVLLAIYAADIVYVCVR